MKQRLLWLLMAGGVSLLGTGCASLFPSTRTTTESQWNSYEEVESAFDKIVPYQTKTNELKEMGFYPSVSPNVKILTYVDIIQRFMPNPGITKEDLPDAVRACIEVKEQSHALELELSDIKGKRHGNLFLDMLGFKRLNHEKGWQFKGLVLIKNDLVVYKLTSGQPVVSREEKRVKPLGPLQEIEGMVSRGIEAAR